MKSTDYEMKYEVAIDYYEHGDYYRALQLFEQIIPAFRGTDKADKIYYYYAYCYFDQEEYLLASYYFKRYAKNFPRSEKAEECLFMSAYCYYLDSPKYSLDQSNTTEAIKELQLFVDLYPQSERVGECNTLIDDLREKLQKKAYENAMLYYKMGEYRSAVVSMENLMDEYPDTEYKEQILFYITKSYYKYAMNSIKDKQRERFAMAIESYNNLMYLYPETEFSKEAGNIYSNSLERVKN